MDTDACIHPYPAGNSSVRRMAIEAGALGFSGIVVPGEMPGVYQGVHIIPAVLIRENDIRKVTGQIRKHGASGILIFVDAGDTGFNRAVLAQTGVHGIRSIHRIPKKMHLITSLRVSRMKMVLQSRSISTLLFMKGVFQGRGY